MLKKGRKERLDVDKKFVTLLIFGLICALLLILLVNLSINTSSGIRANIAAEGFWTKAQKEAVIHLTNYIYSEDENDYENFHAVLRINNGLEVARLELQKEDFDYEIVFQSLVAGRNHPDDIPHIVNVFRRFHWVDEVEKAGNAWAKGDEKIKELSVLADKIRESIRIGDNSSDQRAEWSAELGKLDHELTDIELNFSDAMGDFARTVNTTLRWSTILLGLILLGLGIWLTLRFLKSAESWMQTLEESEERFRTLLKNSRDVIYKMNLKTQQYEYVSPAIKDMLGYETSEFLEGGPKWIYANIHPEDKESMERVIKRYEHIKKDNFLPVVEFRLKDKSGNYRWVSNVRTLVKDEQGEPAFIVGSVRDISEKKEQDDQLRESLNEKEILLQEIHHRVKNNLSIVSSLLELQKDGVSLEVQELLSASQSRIKSIAKVHEKLYKSATLSEIPMDVYITELAEEIANAYDSDKKEIEMQLDVVPFVMDINQAIPCGLILNELINNGYKHGFEGLEKGITRVSLKKKGEGMELKVENNGNKLPDNFDPSGSSSLGMTLILVLIKRFNGKLNIKSGEWTSFSIYFEN
ncbi:MAG: histidine kinase dimerization/phosphoacceptor domain -containing protein [Balneolaceae bacterium]